MALAFHGDKFPSPQSKRYLRGRQPRLQNHKATTQETQKEEKIQKTKQTTQLQLQQNHNTKHTTSTAASAAPVQVSAEAKPKENFDDDFLFNPGTFESPEMEKEDEQKERENPLDKEDYSKLKDTSQKSDVFPKLKNYTHQQLLSFINFPTDSDLQFCPKIAELKKTAQSLQNFKHLFK